MLVSFIKSVSLQSGIRFYDTWPGLTKSHHVRSSPHNKLVGCPSTTLSAILFNINIFYDTIAVSKLCCVLSTAIRFFAAIRRIIMSSFLIVEMFTICQRFNFWFHRYSTFCNQFDILHYFQPKLCTKGHSHQLCMKVLSAPLF